MNYKYSEYNICVTDDKVYLVFNTLTQSLLELDRNEFSYFKNKKQTYLSNLTDEELKMLNELGFILHVDCSEIDILKDYYDASQEEIVSWLTNDASVFSAKLQGVMKLSDFMVEEDFLDKGPESISEIAFDNVEGN